MPKQRPAKRLRGRRRAQPSRACAPRVSVFPFLELAAETRLQVYEHLLHMPYAIDVSGTWRKRPGLNVSILRANKQLHAETSHFFYSVNAFVLLEHQDDAKAAGSDLAGDDEYMGNKWLPPSLTTLHIYVRTKRPRPSTSALLRALATQAPNLARLALVKEYQSDGYSIFTTGSGWNYHYRRRPLLNKVTSFSSHEMSAFCKEIKGMRGLKVLAVSGMTQKLWDCAMGRDMEKNVEVVGCRVRGLDAEVLGREGWDGFEGVWGENEKEKGGSVDMEKREGEKKDGVWWERVLGRDGDVVVLRSPDMERKEEDGDMGEEVLFCA